MIWMHIAALGLAGLSVWVANKALLEIGASIAIWRDPARMPALKDLSVRAFWKAHVNAAASLALAGAAGFIAGRIL